jgi:hypothetical protein
VNVATFVIAISPVVDHRIDQMLAYLIVGWKAVVGKVIHYDKEDIKLTVTEVVRNIADSILWVRL